ncbi:MAG: YbaN family protein [Pseudomonadota bacterium]|nr:YbaN family protein [Pseudomonadota bacterium]
MLRQTWRLLMIACGVLALALGILGIFLPLLPTTPFVLLAAFFFSRGSARLHRWLVEHPRFGRYIRDWEAEQVIPPVGKYAASLMMVPSVSWVIATREIPWMLEALMAATVAGVLWFIWSRPSRRSEDSVKTETETATTRT